MPSPNKKTHRQSRSLDSVQGKHPAEVKSKAHLENEVDIIGYERANTTGNPNIGLLAQQTMQDVMENADYGSTGYRVVYGNALELELLSEREALQARFGSLEGDVKKLKTRVNTLTTEVGTLTTEVEVLREASIGYRQIRNRFLDVYQRDVIGDPDARWTKPIGLGNAAAHNGDAVVDAYLYQLGERQDTTLFVEIYGLLPEKVLSLRRSGDFSSIAVLNARATVKAKGAEVPQDVEQVWRQYIMKLEDEWGKTPTDPLSALGRAYYRFWDIYNTRCKK
ncbi:MAG: hypothetical protein M1816_007357 [Peltula sp. TS41687]|nr:MAG: hypothetical protein M1816_007357 [Peltula sp. TS41687]